MAFQAAVPFPTGGLEWLIAATFLIITSVSSYQLFADTQPFTLNKIWWLFGSVFLGFVPSIQAAVHHTPWLSGDIRPITMVFANALILGSFGIYIMSRKWGSRSGGQVVSTPFPAVFIHRFTQIAPWLMLACFTCLLVAYGPLGLLLRGHAETAALKYNSSFQLFFDKGLRGVMLYLSIAGILLYRQRALSSTRLWLLLFIAFAGNFPLALPRYLAFTMYVSWLLAAGFLWMQRRQHFTLIVLSLLLLAGPLVTVTRYAGVDMAARLHQPLAIFKKSYLTSDFDAYSSLCRAMQYNELHGSTSGRQLGGVLLFFIPRSAWPDKPIGSGAFIFTGLGADFKNVSCTYLAEGYINWGLTGSGLFTLLLALLITRYDNWYQSHEAAFSSYRTMFYFIFGGMLLFILRGDLLSSFAFTCGLFFSGWLVHCLFMGQVFIKKR